MRYALLTARIPGPTVLAVERGDLAVDPVPVDLARQKNQFVLQIDNLVEPRPEQIARPRRLVLLRSHRFLRCITESWFATKRNIKNKIASFQALKPRNTAIPNPHQR